MKTTKIRLGWRQQQMLDFVKKHHKPNQVFSVHPDENRVAISLEKKGLINVIDCGMSTATGRKVLMVSLKN